MAINSFRGEYAFLSNMYSSPFTIDGEYYLTNEHYFQAMKCKDAWEAKEIRSQATPALAKKLGKTVTIRDDWNSVKVDVMIKGLRAKFSDPKLKEMLLATGDEELIEGNSWKDTYWGVYEGEGYNKLGRLLMELRDELRRNKE